MESTQARILIFGSSRANRHYVPEVFEEAWDLDYHNVARDGTGVFYHYAILTGILKRYSPHIIVLDLTPREFDKSQYPYNNLSFLLPYAQRHSEIRSIVELRSRYEKLKLLSQIYPFNSYLLSIAKGMLEHEISGQEDNKGYIPLSGKWVLPMEKAHFPRDTEIDQVRVDYFDRFVSLAQGSGIQVYVIVSPFYQEFDNTPPSIQIARDICRDRRVPFFDFSQSDIFHKRPELFRDTGHLNHEGAQIFSRMAVSRIQTPDKNAISKVH